MVGTGRVFPKMLSNSRIMGVDLRIAVFLAGKGKIGAILERMMVSAIVIVCHRNSWYIGRTSQRLQEHIKQHVPRSNKCSFMFTSDWLSLLTNQTHSHFLFFSILNWLPFLTIRLILLPYMSMIRLLSIHFNNSSQ